MENVIKYVQETLGIATKIIKVNKEELNHLPFFILNTFEIWKTVIFDKEVFLFEKATTEHLTPLQYRKQMMLLVKKLNSPIIFVLTDMKAYDRNRLIQQKVNFIIEDKQIFIPQLLIDLKEYQPKIPVGTENLQPAAQVIILYHILKKPMDGLNYKQIATLLDYSYLTISRAIENLVNLKLCATAGTKEKTLVLQTDKKKLWELAIPYFKLPIKKSLFINDRLPDDLIFISDINALAHYTDLNNENINHYAINHTDFLRLKKEGLIKKTSQYDGEYKIDLWRYNPNILTDTKYVDPLSLYITYKETKDERIEMGLEQIIEQFIW